MDAPKKMPPTIKIGSAYVTLERNAILGSVSTFITENRTPDKPPQNRTP
jgi:hypothetical protein